MHPVCNISLSLLSLGAEWHQVQRVLQAVNKRNGQAFSAADEANLKLFSMHLGNTLTKSRLYASILWAFKSQMSSMRTCLWQPSSWFRQRAFWIMLQRVEAWLHVWKVIICMTSRKHHWMEPAVWRSLYRSCAPCRFEKQRLETLNEGIRDINAPSLTLDNLVAAINKWGSLCTVLALLVILIHLTYSLPTHIALTLALESTCSPWLPFSSWVDLGVCWPIRRMPVRKSWMREESGAAHQCLLWQVDVLSAAMRAGDAVFLRCWALPDVDTMGALVQPGRKLDGKAFP